MPAHAVGQHHQQRLARKAVPDAKVKSYRLTNMLEQTVQEGSLLGKEIDLSALESGVYIINIQLQNGENINQKIIKN